MHISIENCKAVSAIYYGLLGQGYDYYKLEKNGELCSVLERFAAETPVFFAGAKRSTCAVYPYWPRAAMLETASFSINGLDFVGLESYRQRIMTAPNLLEEERSGDFWEWIVQFPAALRQVLSDRGFQAYFEWECT